MTTADDWDVKHESNISSASSGNIQKKEGGPYEVRNLNDRDAFYFQVNCDICSIYCTNELVNLILLLINFQ